tara:strand:- start:1393 stop:2685 length:1293 start_codon:yes stop_codon:yes gene_type:complete
MAYPKKSLNTFMPGLSLEGVAKIKDISDVYKAAINNADKWYELEPAEVIKVYLEEEDLPLIKDSEDPNWSYYGCIEARMCTSHDTGNDIVMLKPLDTNIKQYPHPGEYVVAVEYLSSKYYTQKLNYMSSVNLNSYPGLSKPGFAFGSGDRYNIRAFKELNAIREIKSYEGDITFNGRFGQSIRFGSNVTELTEKLKKNFPSGGPIDTKGTDSYSPNIIMRAGQAIATENSAGEPSSWDLDVWNNQKPVLEDINADASSIWITTNQIIGLTKSVKSKVKKLDPKDFDGKQIILNSDRLIFNSKLSDIFLYSSRDINLITKNRIVLEGHKNVYLGLAPKQGDKIGYWKSNKRYRSRYPNIQPVLKGDDTMKIIELLIDVINDFSVQLHGAIGGSWVPVPLTQINAASRQLTAALNRLKTRLDKPKSKLVGTI